MTIQVYGTTETTESAARIKERLAELREEWHIVRHIDNPHVVKYWSLHASSVSASE